MNPTPTPLPTSTGSWGDSVLLRPKLTAKALRALGRPVPQNIDDNETIVLITKENQ